MKNEIEALVKEFAYCVAKQAELMELGKGRQGNEFAKRYVDAFGRLRVFGNEGREGMKNLLTDERPSVRIMAAAYLLRYCESEARAVLELESKKKGLLAFGAVQALERWRDGTWSLDPA